MTKNRKRKPNYVLRIAAILLILGAAAVFLMNKWETHVELIGPKHYHVQTGGTFEDPGIIAEKRGTLLPFLHRKLKYTAEGTVDGSTGGTYTIRYVIDGVTDAETERIVTVSDTVAPVITLNEIEGHYTVPNHIYEEEGYTAYDSMDGDVTSLVQTKELNGFVYYSVTDSSGNTGIAIRRIFYDDRTPPSLILEGGGEVTVWVGSDFEDSYSAVDDADGDITSSVKVTGTVDTSTEGDYELTYTSTDTHGNTVTVSRTVHVKNKPVNNDTGVEGPKVIYLTFDDGPYRYTETLLDILDKYNVKATFFTTSAYPAYAYCMKLEAQRGHTVCVHTRTHDYASIYSSTDAYWADFNYQNGVIYEQTGQYTTMFRFPGGSSNTVSRNYCSGIMTALARQSAEKGLVYFDWNVSSGDAGLTTSTEVVYQNVISGIKGNSAYGKPSVVLQHDVKDYSVAAVERIILWGLENGYSFRALTPESYTAHHGIAN